MNYVKVNCYSTSALSLFYGEVAYPLRGALEVKCEGWPKMRRLAVWRLMPEDGFRVSDVIEHLADWFFVQTHQRPSHAFMRKLPTGVESGIELDGVTLFEVDWALEKCVMVGG